MREIGSYASSTFCNHDLILLLSNFCPLRRFSKEFKNRGGFLGLMVKRETHERRESLYNKIKDKDITISEALTYDIPTWNNKFGTKIKKKSSLLSIIIKKFSTSLICFLKKFIFS